ncbi:MAG: GNAT family N-acetyltransferase [Oscillibacter sp.]|nr:GNAT family N-acetyltransferase [Oscillibacter sp.]
MLTYRDIRAEDQDIVIPMVEKFYTTDAVDHPVPTEILTRSFQDVADPQNTLVRGVLIFEGEEPIGYIYLTPCYSCEVGGVCIFIEEIFLLEQYQGKGYGKQAMDWLMAQYPDCRRIRLEVTQVNQRAVRLYETCGFTYLRYDQMVLDRL